MKKLFLFALALALFSTQPVASAQVPPSFMTVDAVRVHLYSLIVTGVARGDSTPSERTITFTTTQEAQRTAVLDRCHKMLLLALAKPGQYLVQAGQDVCNVALATP
jgi:hypothetical protein